MWLKYASEPISTADYRDIAQMGPREDGYRSEFNKPLGCWITDDSEEDWRSWCVGEKFRLDELTHKHQVILDESAVLILRDASQLDDFTLDFGAQVVFGSERFSRTAIAWERVAERYAGIIITPYQWSQRMSLMWYYGWDCASGCIWKASVIREIRLLEVDHEIAKPRLQIEETSDA